MSGSAAMAANSWPKPVAPPLTRTRCNTRSASHNCSSTDSSPMRRSSSANVFLVAIVLFSLQLQKPPRQRKEPGPKASEHHAGFRDDVQVGCVGIDEQLPICVKRPRVGSEARECLQLFGHESSF